MSTKTKKSSPTKSNKSKSKAKTTALDVVFGAVASNPSITAPTALKKVRSVGVKTSSGQVAVLHRLAAKMVDELRSRGKLKAAA